MFIEGRKQNNCQIQIIQSVKNCQKTDMEVSMSNYLKDLKIFQKYSLYQKVKLPINHYFSNNIRFINQKVNQYLQVLSLIQSNLRSTFDEQTCIV